MQNNQAIPFNKENFKQILSKEFMLVIFMSVPAALIGSYFNVPLAWFLGPMIVTCVASFNGIQTKIPELVRSVTLIMLGLYIGNYIERDCLYIVYCLPAGRPLPTDVYVINTKQNTQSAEFLVG